jgi:pilus assembly protein CpaB
MNIKWVTMGLVALGIVAAICAAVLVASLQGGDPDEVHAIQDVNVVVAARDLQAMTVLSDSDVVTRTVKQTLAPLDAFGDAVQVIGKVLTTPISAGQAITSEAFTTDGSPMRLAAALPAGQRAVTITLDERFGGTELLYPGCLVDVLATMQMTLGDEPEAQPVTITLLQGISVLAIRGLTVIAPAADPDALMAQSAAGSGRPTVTLLVEAREAEMLKLALEEGSVSLVLRNPHDLAHPAVGGTDLAALSPAMTAVTGEGEPGEPAPVVPRPLQRSWEATVLRGSTAESRQFEMPAVPNTKP